MKPFVLVQIEDGSEAGNAVYGTTEVVCIVIDWDQVEGDPDTAYDLVEEIIGRYNFGATLEEPVQEVVDRLQSIIDGPEWEDEDEEVDEDEDEDEDDEDTSLTLQEFIGGPDKPKAD